MNKLRIECLFEFIIERINECDDSVENMEYTLVCIRDDIEALFKRSKKKKHKAKAKKRKSTGRINMYSKYDSRGYLVVDCSECERGGNGSDKDKCACGEMVKKPHIGSCFSGTLIEKYKSQERGEKV